VKDMGDEIHPQLMFQLIWPPKRVIINEEGEATDYRRATQIHKVGCDVVFIRNDWWTLGTPMNFMKTAYDTWSDQWTHVWLRGHEKPITIKEFHHLLNQM